jgi:hypothetical protein
MIKLRSVRRTGYAIGMGREKCMQDFVGRCEEKETTLKI